MNDPGYWMWWTEEDGTVTCWHWMRAREAAEAACGVKLPESSYRDFRGASPTPAEPGCPKCCKAYQEGAVNRGKDE